MASLRSNLPAIWWTVLINNYTWAVLAYLCKCLDATRILMGLCPSLANHKTNTFNQWIHLSLKSNNDINWRNDSYYGTYYCSCVFHSPTPRKKTSYPNNTIIFLSLAVLFPVGVMILLTVHLQSKNINHNICRLILQKALSFLTSCKYEPLHCLICLSHVSLQLSFITKYI